jgi:hypothetical protein
MEYYRETESKGKLTLIRDYYKNGTLQMEGLVSDYTESEVFEGKITWYNPEGKVLTTGTFSGGNQVGPAKTFDEQGRILEDLTYKADGTFTGRFTCIKIRKKCPTIIQLQPMTLRITKSVVYDEDIKGIRYEIITDNKKGSYETKFYGEKGKYIGTNNSANSGDNVTVEYYYNPMKVAKIEKQNKDGIVIESVIYSKKGEFYRRKKKNRKDGYKKTYDEAGKQIGNLTYIYEKENDFYRPFEGDDYQFNYLFSGLRLLILIKTEQQFLKIFDEDGKLSYDRILKDEMTRKSNIIIRTEN